MEPDLSACPHERISAESRDASALVMRWFTDGIECWSMRGVCRICGATDIWLRWPGKTLEQIIGTTDPSSPFGWEEDDGTALRRLKPRDDPADTQ